MFNILPLECEVNFSFKENIKPILHIKNLFKTVSTIHDSIQFHVLKILLHILSDKRYYYKQ